MREFKEPILSRIYEIIGFLVLILGLLGSLLAAIGSAFFGNATSSPEAGVVILVVTVLVALPLFGIAQVITYFGRTAFHVQSIDEQIAAVLGRETQDNRFGMSAVLERVMPVSTPRDIKFKCEACGQPLEAPRDMTGEVVECPKCKTAIMVQQPPDTKECRS